MAKDHFLHLTEQGIVDATEQVYRLCDPGADLPVQRKDSIFSLILAKYMESYLICKGHVTAGVTRDIIEELTITNRSPFHILPDGHEKAVWVETDHVCVVEYMPNIKNSLRQPVFEGFRQDVLPEDVIVE